MSTASASPPEAFQARQQCIAQFFDARLAFEQLEVARAWSWLVALEQAFDAALTQHLESVENTGSAAAAKRGDLGGQLRPPPVE